MKKTFTILLLISLSLTSCSSEDGDLIQDSSSLESNDQTIVQVDDQIPLDDGFLLDESLNGPPLSLIFYDRDVPPAALVMECGAINSTNVSQEWFGDGSFAYVFESNNDGQIVNEEFRGSYETDNVINDLNWSWSAYAGMYPILSLSLDDSFKENDLLEIKWSSVTTPYENPLNPELIKSSAVEVQRCSDGTLYVNDSLDSLPTAGGIVEVYSGDQVIDSTRFSVSQ